MTQPSCIRTHPKLVPNASQYTSKGFSTSGCAKTGAEVSKFAKCGKPLHTSESKQTSHPFEVIESWAWLF
jgi:hypothetical protein